MYWLVSLPHGGRVEHAWSRLQEATTYTNDYSANFKFALPESFRVGTLDSLLALSDDLAKVNAAVEGTVNKVRRQLVELQSGVAPEDRADVWVEGQTPEGYLQRFAWNEAKYPSRRPLKEIVASIMETVQKLDDDLKVGTPPACASRQPAGARRAPAPMRTMCCRPRCAAVPAMCRRDRPALCLCPTAACFPTTGQGPRGLQAAMLQGAPRAVLPAGHAHCQPPPLHSLSPGRLRSPSFRSCAARCRRRRASSRAAWQCATCRGWSPPASWWTPRT